MVILPARLQVRGQETAADESSGRGGERATRRRQRGSFHRSSWESLMSSNHLSLAVCLSIRPCTTSIPELSREGKVDSSMPHETRKIKKSGILLLGGSSLSASAVCRPWRRIPS